MAAVARRYAQAMIELARESGDLRSVQSELEKLGAMWSESPDLREAFETPELGTDARKALVDAMSSKAGASTHVTNFLRLLADRRRMESLSAIVSEFVALAEAATDQVRAQVTTAVQLDDDYYRRLQGTLESITGKTVTLERDVDPEILGGVIARVGGRVFDGSLRSRLSELHETLITE